jgi:hypothetical protein
MIKLWFFSFTQYGFCLMFMTIFVILVKKTVRRQRPEAVRAPGRKIESLRHHEKLSFAMPSGDTSCATCFLSLVAL